MTIEELTQFLTPLQERYIHASNMLKKLQDNSHLDFLLECADEYKNFHEKFIPNNLSQTIDVWNKYVQFVREKNPFSYQSKFDSTILEEAMYRLFKEFDSGIIHTGGVKAYSNLYFNPSHFEDFKTRSLVNTNTKNQDFAIYKQVNVRVDDSEERITLCVPVFALECKTYLDKTMLESSVATAEKIKMGNPSCRFCIVTESYQVDSSVELKNSRIDQIYVLSKSKRDKNRPVVLEKDVVELLYNDTKKHLTQTWSDIEQNIRTKGIVIS